MRLENFTLESWEKLFGAFAKVNRSHWRGAPFDAVMNQLKTQGRFEFTVTGMNTWTCKFVLTLLPSGQLDAALVPNPALSVAMQQRLQQMQEEFARAVQELS